MCRTGWMKVELPRMQGDSRRKRHGDCRIAGRPEIGQLPRGQLDANLVLAAGLQRDFQQHGVLEFAQHTVGQAGLDGTRSVRGRRSSMLRSRSSLRSQSTSRPRRRVRRPRHQRPIAACPPRGREIARESRPAALDVRARITTPVARRVEPADHSHDTRCPACGISSFRYCAPSDTRLGRSASTPIVGNPAGFTTASR